MPEVWRVTKIIQNVAFEMKTFDNSSLKLHCEAMTSALAKKFQMDKCKFRDIPIAAGTQMIETTDVPLDNRTEYLSLVGSLVYIANLARPDISFSVHLLAKQNAKPSKRHMSIARDVLGYLWHSRSKGLVFHRGQLVNGGEDKKKLSLIGCSDADYANDRSNCKSVSGGVIFLEGMIVDYFCKKQAHVSRSTMEAEFIALSALTEKLLFYKSLMRFLKCDLRPISMYCDNQSTIEAYGNESTTKRSRYIDVSYHFVKLEAIRSNLKILYVQSEANVADILTKIPKPNLFKKFSKWLLGN